MNDFRKLNEAYQHITGQGVEGNKLIKENTSCEVIQVSPGKNEGTYFVEVRINGQSAKFLAEPESIIGGISREGELLMADEVAEYFGYSEMDEESVEQTILSSLDQRLKRGRF